MKKSGKGLQQRLGALKAKNLFNVVGSDVGPEVRLQGRLFFFYRNVCVHHWILHWGILNHYCPMTLLIQRMKRKRKILASQQRYSEHETRDFKAQGAKCRACFGSKE